MTEKQFCEIAEELLKFHDEAQSNENCGIGNDEVNLHRARDLAKKYNLQELYSKLSVGGYEPDYTAEDYVREREEKIELVRNNYIQKEQKKIKYYQTQLKKYEENKELYDQY